MYNGPGFDTEIYSNDSYNLFHGNGESLNSALGSGGIAAIE